MVRRVLTHLRKGVADCKNRAKKPVAVFDVDETLLFNHPRSGDHRVATNAPVREIYDWCVENKVPVYVITARIKSEWSYKLLKNQLEALGYDKVSKTYMVNSDFKDDADPSGFKAFIRGRIRDDHKRTLLLNVGDQTTDHIEAGRRQSVPAMPRRDAYYGLLDIKEHPAMLGVKLPEEAA
jgi:hypothetical protein